MTATELQQTILDNIPLSGHMGYTITALSEQHIHVCAPLANNINIHGTAFAGSLYSLATLTAWGLTYHMLQCHTPGTTVVLKEATIQYRAPITSDISCNCTVADETRQTFLETLQAHGRSHLTLNVTINQATHWQGTLTAFHE